MTAIRPKPSSLAARIFFGSVTLLALLSAGHFFAPWLSRLSRLSRPGQPQPTFAWTHEQISLGEELLIDEVASDDKRAGIAAFEQGDFLSAIQNFQTSLLQQPNDPETLIYLNNARSQHSPSDAVQIAVSIPAGNNPAIAQEMLRGVAQAQDAINELGIHGAQLEIVIANDDNNEAQALAIAPKLIADAQILAVIGSNASDPSLAAAALYNPAGLTMISPTSFSGRLSNFGAHTFRTIPNMKSLAEALARHAIEQGKAKMAI